MSINIMHKITHKFSLLCTICTLFSPHLHIMRLTYFGSVRLFFILPYSASFINSHFSQNPLGFQHIFTIFLKFSHFSRNTESRAVKICYRFVIYYCLSLQIQQLPINACNQPEKHLYFQSYFRNMHPVRRSLYSCAFLLSDP